MKLFINTGGKGERLYPLTKDNPKPLVPISNKPVLHYLVEWAKKYEIKEIIMMNGYKAEKIIDYVKDGKDFGINIVHSNEPRPLGSGGAIKFAKKHIDEEFVYISGDLLCAVDLKKMINFHKNHNADMTVFLHKSNHPHDSDILEINKDGKVERFISKDEKQNKTGNLSNAGLCIINPKILDLMDKDEFTLETYLYPKILEKNMRLFGYVSEEFISDMGTFDGLKKCETFLIDNKQLFS